MALDANGIYQSELLRRRRLLILMVTARTPAHRFSRRSISGRVMRIGGKPAVWEEGDEGEASCDLVEESESESDIFEQDGSTERPWGPRAFKSVTQICLGGAFSTSGVFSNVRPRIKNRNSFAWIGDKGGMPVGHGASGRCFAAFRVDRAGHEGRKKGAWCVVGSESLSLARPFSGRSYLRVSEPPAWDAGREAQV
ncbi:hypothetical protein TREMEDRAFT_59317 [Tremella mesenterica DSM 1558]|uniref:uncharacterized protein n=1 Tax=Tremella mesenterica (strain ATCC 24925 / CBS 8224 / DSM 1558 / NBRC 9311 / NRRL Y-6157 / RJB 2259-6 / UBC 559-6) TaxID=578456 RepID=UPI0003F48D8F|nr:uncharacterized protein TREMEDRAFT_59317 [Tremella mesenterica DSM 1558]EIW73154.1 hypothetical protein TREMEDRAFT_59317 [Tremella mesenterica DSM 1558]